MNIQSMKKDLSAGIITEPVIQLKMGRSMGKLRPEGEARGVYDNGKQRKVFKVEFSPDTNFDGVWSGDSSYDLRQVALFLNRLADVFDEMNVSEVVE